MNLSRREACGLGLGAMAAVALPRPAHAAFNVEIMAPYYKSLITMAPLAVGLERGDYAKHGINVTGVLTSVGGGTGIRNMIGAGLPYAEMSTAAVLIGLKVGLDIKIVHNSIRTVSDILWVTMPDSGIKSIKDLAGKRVGISTPKSTSETLARMAFEVAGMPNSAQLVALGPVGAQLSALENKGVDAAFIMEPLYSQRRDKYAVAFTLDHLPLMSQNVGVATKEFIKSNPNELKAIIAARRDAVDYIYADTEKAAAMVSKRYGDTLPPDVAPVAMKRMAAIKYWSRGEIEMEAFRSVVKGLEMQGQWDGTLDWESVIDRSFLPKDLQG
jgi:NitT/TauT family transport system substrate-binding protein